MPIRAKISISLIRRTESWIRVMLWLDQGIPKDLFAKRGGQVPWQIEYVTSVYNKFDRR